MSAQDDIDRIAAEAIRKARATAIFGETYAAADANFSQNGQMVDFVPRPELDAKLDAAEARMDARFARVEATMTTIVEQLKGLKDDNVSLRQEVTDLRTETRSAGREFKYWAAASILAIVGTGVGIQQMTTSTFAGGSQFAKEQTQVVNDLKQIQQELVKQKEFKFDERGAVPVEPPSSPGSSKP